MEVNEIKAVLIFQVMTEAIILLLVALALAPKELSFHAQAFGVRIAFKIAELMPLPSNLITPYLAALLSALGFMFFITFTFTVKLPSKLSHRR